MDIPRLKRAGKMYAKGVATALVFILLLALFVFCVHFAPYILILVPACLYAWYVWDMSKYK